MRDDEPRFHVRHAEPGDAVQLVALARAVGSEPEGWLVTNGDWRSVPEERRYLRAIKRSPHAAVIVAEAAAGIVGRLSLSRDPHPASRHVADLGLMVAMDFRRKGAGLALMLAADEWAQSVGVRKLELHVLPYNEAAIALYERLDYVREGVRKNHYRRNEGYVDAVLMAKEHVRALVILLGVCALVAACGGSAQGDKDGAIEAARDLYDEENADGRDFSSGPCLANPLPEPHEDWVVDVVHEPREESDDDAANQCSAYADGRAGHFIELDEFGHLVTAQ